MDDLDGSTTGGVPATRGEAASRVPAWAAALAGAASGLVALGAGELAAGLFGGPSLVIAIGDLVISLQPPGAKDVVVSLFGTNDKLALSLAILLVAVAIAAVAGLLARIRLAYGIAVFVAVGAVAALAAWRSPLVQPPLAVAVAVVAVAAGCLALRWLLARAGPPAAAVEGGDGDAGTAVQDRRRFLIASAGAAGGAVIAGVAGRLLLEGPSSGTVASEGPSGSGAPDGVVSSSKLPAALEQVPPLAPDQSLAVDGITPIVLPADRLYRIDTALLVPRVDVERWELKVTGMVDRPLTFTYDDLLTMPLVEEYVTISCVSNEVGGHLVGNALWTGVRLRDVLEMAGVQAGATQIVGRSVDGFTAGFPTSWALAPGREALIAVGLDREPLPPDHGFPARLVVPGLYGYVSATKWLSEIELTTREAVDGYWVPLGWAKDAPILTQSRIDVPGRGARLAPGPTTVAGVAWAPDRGIEAVEVRIDDGEWRAATISRPISAATWVQWSIEWAADAGRHTIEVRATDGDGVVQTDQETPPAPDGARGYHRITVDVG